MGEPELLAGGPALPVEDVLPEQGEEGFHGGVVAGGGDLAHRAGQLVVAERGEEFSGTKLPRSECTMQPVTSPRRATAMLRVSTAILDFIRSLIE